MDVQHAGWQFIHDALEEPESHEELLDQFIQLIEQDGTTIVIDKFALSNPTRLLIWGPSALQRGRRGGLDCRCAVGG